MSNPARTFFGHHATPRIFDWEVFIDHLLTRREDEAVSVSTGRDGDYEVTFVTVGTCVYVVSDKGGE